MVKELTLKDLKKFESFDKYKNAEYKKEKEKVEEWKASGRDWVDVFLMCPLKETNPLYGKKVKPIGVYDDNGIPIGVNFEYI